MNKVAIIVISVGVIVVLASSLFMISLFQYPPNEGFGKRHTYIGYSYSFEIENISSNETEVHEMLLEDENITINNRRFWDPVSSKWFFDMTIDSDYFGNNTASVGLYAIYQMSSDIDKVRITISHIHDIEFPFEKSEEAEAISNVRYEKHKEEGLDQDLEIQEYFTYSFGEPVSLSYHERIYGTMVD